MKTRTNDWFWNVVSELYDKIWKEHVEYQKMREELKQSLKIL